MGAYLGTNTGEPRAAIQAPFLLKKGESGQVFLFAILSGPPTITVFHILPNGEHIDVSVNLVALPGVFISVWRLNISLNIEGLHTFAVVVNDTTMQVYAFASVQCAGWISNIDVPVSQLERQRADIQRVYSRVNNR